MNATSATIAADVQSPQAHSGFAGTNPQSVDRVLAALVQDNYDRADQLRGHPPIDRPLPAGWARMGDEEVRAAGIDPARLHDTKSGFDASFYRDAGGNVALIYAGTDEGQDWRHNFGQGLGFEDAQYDQAIAVAREAKLAFGDRLVLSGQSLGGGLAAAAAMVNEVPAVTFNAAGVHDNTVERYGLDADAVKLQADQGLVRHYVVENDILTHLQEDAFPLNLAMPDAPGVRIDLPDPDPLTTFERLLPWKTWPHRVDNHYIEAVMEAMDKAGYTLDAAEPTRAARQDASLDTANRLLGDSVRGLAPQRDRLGLQDDERFFNAAANVAMSAGRDGLQRIDHVVAAASGRSAFVVEGGLDDAGHRRSQVDVETASRIPAPESAALLREQASAQGEQGRQQEEQRRMALA
jgi:hypothetical protein